MSGRVEQTGEAALLTHPRLAVGSIGFAALALALELSGVTAASTATGALYHTAFYGDPGMVERYAAVGLLAAVCYALPFLSRGDYSVQGFLDGRRNAGRVFMTWNYAFLCLALIGFLTKSTDTFSRGWVLLFYISGLVTVLAAEGLIRIALRGAIRTGRLAKRRVLLVGSGDDIARQADEIAARDGGVWVVATIALPAPDGAGVSAAGFERALEAAVAEARARRVDDVVVVSDWARTEFIARVSDAFVALPVAVHLGTSPVLERFAEPRISRIGRATALSLSEPPLGPGQVLAKRVFDVVVAATALVLLAPLFALIAVLIRRDSPGPVFFRQRRRGYNLEEFRIWKFRTMTTLDDGDTVVQAQRNDARVTRVGRVLRRYNLDELPQLLNVISGQMSIVGPRPHAVAHDKLFEQRIDAYRRRLNVKPGITGWAQVNGLRGQTHTDDDMRARVEHDLYYIDNWSIGLDLVIIAMTVVSPKAYRNAH